MRFGTVLGALAIATLVSASSVRADEYDRLTYITFSGPVQLPGVTLSAGTYTFKLADLAGNRHLVQVFDKAQGKLVTTLMTIPNDRLTPAKDTYIMFAERPAGSPQAMKAWFYPGRTSGEEFVYPKRQALALAKANREPVLSTEGESIDVSTAKNSKVARVDGSGNAEVDALAQSSSPSTAREPVGGAASISTRANASANQSSRPARSQLPRTGGSVVLVGLMGGLALLSGAGLNRLRRR